MIALLTMIAGLRRMLLTASLLSSLAASCSGSDAGSGPAGSGGAPGAAGQAGGGAGGAAGSAAGWAGESGNGKHEVDGSAAGSRGSDAADTADSGAMSQAGGDAGGDADSGGAGGHGAADASADGPSDGAADALATDGRALEAGTSPCPFTSAAYFLWAGVAPGSNGSNLVEKITERSTDPAVHDRAVASISRPSLAPYLAPRPNGAAAIIMPGGGYAYEAFDKEGIDIATWLNSLGVSAFVLRYRLPADFPGSPWIPLADAQRAIRTVRRVAAACALDPARIGVIGFSAGGHLASQLETRFSAPTSSASDATDAVDARPGFGILIYPVISMDASITHQGSKTKLLGANPTAADVKLYSSELQVTSSTPPTFIAVSNQDTTVSPQNSIRFDNALEAAGVAHELHLYQDGAHGTGIRDAKGDMADWPKQAAAWLTLRQLLGPAKP